MTNEQANQINIETETNIETLRELVKFWQNEATEAVKKISNLQTKLSDSEIPTKVNTKKIKDIINKMDKY